MAKIIGLEKQEEVIRNISSGVKEITKTNTFLNTTNASGEFTVSFKDAEGKKISSTFICSDRQVIDELVQKYKENVANELAAQAEEYRIELEQEEKDVLGLK